MNKWLLLVCLLGARMSAQADEPTGTFFDGTVIPCPSATSQVQWGECHHQALQRADRELNVLYGKLMAIADEKQKRHLRSMQQAWIQLKLAQCAFVVDYHDGAAHPSQFGTYCEAVLTIRRLRELEQLGTGLLWQSN
ncbi:MAG: lysozyme inhibitor LprI family protein [Lysobacterales bacterium]|nr:DUF1311 domain-containing protein [Xanthomonadales bacterium]MCP5473949.1 DUF1311 domain-containing protein [Rhodanobacteraceae bacterium]